MQLEIVQKSKFDLVKQSELFEPMTYYGLRPKIAFEYISDIHLLHHTRFFNFDVSKTIKVLAKSLYASINVSRKEVLEPIPRIRIFLGDISSDRDVTVEFYRQYLMQNKYSQYRDFRSTVCNMNDIHTLEMRRDEYILRHTRLKAYKEKINSEIKQMKEEIKEFVNYSRLIAPKGSLMYIKAYLEGEQYKKRNCPDFVTEKIISIAQLCEMIVNLDRAEEKILSVLDQMIPKAPILLKGLFKNLVHNPGA